MDFFTKLLKSETSVLGQKHSAAQWSFISAGKYMSGSKWGLWHDEKNGEMN